MIKLTKQKIDDMRTSLGKGAQPFTKEAIDSLCYLALKGLTAPEQQVNELAKHRTEHQPHRMCETCPHPGRCAQLMVCQVGGTDAASESSK